MEALGFRFHSRRPEVVSSWRNHRVGVHVPRYDIPGFNYEHCGGLGNADAVLDHSDGTVNPQVDFENNGIRVPTAAFWAA